MTRMARKAAVFALLFLTPAAWAGSYSVHPVTVALTQERPATTLRVRNAEGRPLTLQVVMKHWSQPGGEDELSDTRDVIAVPPMFTIPPGQDQIVRVGLRKPAAVGQEQAYRLILKEIPASTQPAQGLHLALNMSLPVFVQPAAPAAAQLDWHARRLEDGRLEVSVSNRGTGHFKFTEWRMLDDGETLASGEKLHYLLPGTRKQWTLAPDGLPAAGEPLDIQVVSAGRTLRTQAMVK